MRPKIASAVSSSFKLDDFMRNLGVAQLMDRSEPVVRSSPFI